MSIVLTFSIATCIATCNAPDLDMPRSHSVMDNLRSVDNVLVNHFIALRRYPSDKRGPDFALFRLRRFALSQLEMQLDPSVFSITGVSKARWDTTTGRLRGGDFYYRNESLDIEPNVRRTEDYYPILLVSKPGAADRVIIACGDGLPMIFDYRPHPGQELVYMFVTREHFIATNEEIAQEWSRTHGLSIPGNAEWFSRDDRLVSLTQEGEGLKIDFVYDNEGWLTKCEIRTPVGMIVERIETDRWGRLIAIERSPSDWEERWQSVIDMNRD